jgi:hypothetical protein
VEGLWSQILSELKQKQYVCSLLGFVILFRLLVVFQLPGKFTALADTDSKLCNDTHLQAFPRMAFINLERWGLHVCF